MLSCTILRPGPSQRPEVLNTPRSDHTATLLNNGTVLIAGGEDSNGLFLSSAELYNPATGTFAPTGSMNATRSNHTATLLNDGTVLIAGGQQSFNGPPTGSELYDPASETFSPTTGSLNIPRFNHRATLLNDGTVLIAGGSVPAANGFNFTSSAELYDPATGTFTLTGSMNTARAGFSAILLNNGTVLVASGSSTVASPELYTPWDGTFSPTQGLPGTDPFDATATLLTNGTVLFAGGAFNPTIAELYDPLAGTFSYTSSLNQGRFFHTATLLTNGTVLIAGGISNNSITNSAELYEPVTLTPPSLLSIAVTPAVATLSPGATQRFIATGTFSDNSTEQLASVMWSTSDATVAQISNDASNHGVALAVAPGNVTITGAVGTVSGTATLTVNNP